MKNINPSTHEVSQDLSKLPPAAKAELIERSEIVLIKPKGVMLQSYDYSENVYFIFDVLITSYLKNGAGNTVKWVRGNGDFAFAWKMENDTFNLRKQFTGQIMVALEETQAIKISFENLEWLQNNWPPIREVFSYHVREYFALDKWMQVKAHLTPKDKYEFLQRHVHFQLDKVPDVYLAS